MMFDSLLDFVPAERRFSGEMRRVVIAVECFVHGLLSVGGGFLLLRRIQGELTAPASFALLATTGCFLAVWLTVSFWRTRILPEFGISVSFGVLASIVIASAISIPGSSVFGVIILWTPILTMAGFFSWTQISGLRSEAEVDANSSQESVPLLHEEEIETLDPSIRQSVTRSVDEDGAEVICGKVRCEFEPNERVQNVHIGFCPVLDAEPEVFAEIADGSEADVSIGQILCTGVRFDVKMHHPVTDGTSVLIEFYAKCPVSLRTAT